MNPRLRRLLLWSIALGRVALFLAAGAWQSGRAVEKQAQLEAAERVLAERRALPLAEARRSMPAWVAVEGRFADQPALRLDNQRRGDRVGVRVYRLFEVEGGPALWVDLGWRPLPADRRVPDEPVVPAPPLRLEGLLVPPPSAGLPIGPASSLLPDGGVLALRLEPAVLAGGLDTAVLRLDPALPIGHERDLDLLANTLPPEKHRGYALQWFGFAAGLLLLSLHLQFRRRP